MLSRFRRHFIVLILVFPLLVAKNAASGVTLWQGAFTTPSVWGAMELLFTNEDGKQVVQLRLAPHGRPTDIAVSSLTVSRRNILFITTLAGVQYQFSGIRRGNRFEGTLVPTDRIGERGTWRLAPLALAENLANPDDPFPLPTGRFATGRLAFHWIDERRMELETRLPDDRRELLVYVFYPSQLVAGAARAPYMPEADVMRGAWKDDVIQRLRSLRAHSQVEVPIAKGRERFPVVIFAPGGGQKALAYSSLLEDLASHGYVVAAIEPPYNAAALQFPDGKIIRRLPSAERGWDEPKTRDDMPRIYEQMVVHWARDMSFVVDRLVELNAANGPFWGRLDLSRIGAFGHSRGGQAAGTVRLLDPRFRGGINLDGNIRGKGFQPIAKGDGGKQPFLWIEKQLQRPTDKELREAGLTPAQFEDMWAEGDRLLATVRGGSARVVIAQLGIGHLDFSDYALWDTTNTHEVRAAKLRTLTIARSYVLAFFDGSLRGQWTNLRRLLGDTPAEYPEVSVRRFGQMWPK